MHVFAERKFGRVGIPYIVYVGGPMIAPPTLVNPLK